MLHNVGNITLSQVKKMVFVSVVAAFLCLPKDWQAPTGYKLLALNTSGLKHLTIQYPLCHNHVSIAQTV